MLQLHSIVRAVLKIKRSKVTYEFKDVFEVITFIKYIINICGSKLEKCDFDSMLKNQSIHQVMQIASSFEKKQKSFIDKEKMINTKKENSYTQLNQILNPRENKNFKYNSNPSIKLKQGKKLFIYMQIKTMNL